MNLNAINDTIVFISEPEKVDMADDWYEYATLNHFWIKGRFNAIKKHLPLEISNTRFLEIGCGNGMIIKQLETNYSNLIIDGCDLNLKALHKVDNVKGILYCLNIYDKPSELMKKYDGILLMDVIEHIEDDYSFLNLATSYLKLKGLVIINVPALNFLFSDYDKVAGHKRRYSKKMIMQLFEKNNIEAISISYWGLTLLPIAILRKFILKIVSRKNVIKQGFQPPLRLLNFLLGICLMIENYLFSSPGLGTSIIAIGRLRKSND